MTIREILQRREAVRKEMRQLVDAHPAEMPEASATRFAELETEATALNAAEQRQATIDAMDRAAAGQPVAETPLAEAVNTYGLSREQRMTDLVSRQTGIACANLSAGRAIRGLITGHWQGAEAERRAMGEFVGTAGGFLLPSPVSANIVDLVRNKSVLINAGAITLPMRNAGLRVVQVTADPVASVRGEGTAITETDGAFAALNLHAWSIAAMVRVNNELLDDAPAFAAELDTQLSAVMALKLDSLGLYGSGANEPQDSATYWGCRKSAWAQTAQPRPTMILVLDLLLAIEQANGTPSVLVQSPRSKTKLAKLKNTLNNYFNATAIPDAVNALRMFTSNQISVTENSGIEQRRQHNVRWRVRERGNRHSPGYHDRSEPRGRHSVQAESDARARDHAGGYRRAPAGQAGPPDRHSVTMERRFMPSGQIEVRAAPNGRGVTGFAALYNSPAVLGAYTESIAPGAFSRSLTSGADIVATRDHSLEQLLGRTRSGTLKLASDSRGLHFDIETLPDTQYCRDLHALLESGDLGGASFTFSINPKAGDIDVWQGKSRELRSVTLHEIAVITGFAAYPETANYLAQRSARQFNADAWRRRLAVATV